MAESFAPQLFAAEDRHFWFQSRNTVIARVAAQLVEPLAPGYRVLEVGCGNGNVLRTLEQVCRGGTVIGLDVAEDKLQFARRRATCEVREGDLFRLPPSERYALIGMFDVLEHLDDDAGAIRALSSALVPGGRMLITVPAHRMLWSYADTHAGHCRRYSLRELEAVLSDNGMVVEFATQFMAALFPIVWLGRRISAIWPAPKSAPPPTDRALFERELRIVPGVNEILRALVELEAPWIARRRHLPIGTSLIAIAVKA